MPACAGARERGPRARLRPLKRGSAGRRGARPQRSCSFSAPGPVLVGCRSRCARRRGRRPARRRGARSAPGQAAITPPMSSCATGERRADCRIAREATPAAAIAATTLRRSNANRASGSSRRTRGGADTASSNRAGPRRSGRSDDTAIFGFVPEATFSVPVGVLTAHAHEVGPSARARRSRAPCRRGGASSRPSRLSLARSPPSAERAYDRRRWVWEDELSSASHAPLPWWLSRRQSQRRRPRRRTVRQRHEGHLRHDRSRLLQDVPFRDSLVRRLLRSSRGSSLVLHRPAILVPGARLRSTRRYRRSICGTKPAVRGRSRTSRGSPRRSGPTGGRRPGPGGARDALRALADGRRATGRARPRGRLAQASSRCTNGSPATQLGITGLTGSRSRCRATIGVGKTGTATIRVLSAAGVPLPNLVCPCQRPARATCPIDDRRPTRTVRPRSR